MNRGKNQIEAAADEMFRELLKRIGDIDLTPICPQVENIVRNSIEQNFIEGGRHGSGYYGGGNRRWLPSRRAIKQGGQTLIDTSRLANSVAVKVRYSKARGFRIYLGARTKYAAIHQFGGVINHPGGTPYIIIDGEAIFISKRKAKTIINKFKRTRPNAVAPVKYTKPHKIKIPPRPYLVLQDSD
ncbi:MAG: phage virion morphogenesis protein, partial [Bacteroidota bacterium]